MYRFRVARDTRSVRQMAANEFGVEKHYSNPKYISVVAVVLHDQPPGNGTL
jgi:hypothetical protein